MLHGLLVRDRSSFHRGIGKHPTLLDDDYNRSRYGTVGARYNKF